MIVKECIIEGLGFLGLNQLIEKIKNNESNAEIDMFVNIAKNVVEEICCDYYPLKVTETVSFNNGKLYFSSLNSPIDIFALKVDGISCPFTLYYDRIEADIAGKAQLTYSYAAQVSSISSNLPFTQKISPRIIGYGIACEYCVINGMAEAVTFDKRYRDGLKKAILKKSEKRIRSRAWL